MISQFLYNALKLFENSPEGITEEEYKEAVKNCDNGGSTAPSVYELFVGDWYIFPKDCEDGKCRYILTDKAKDHIKFRENWFAYKPKMEVPSAGAGYVIVERKSGTFGTGIYHMNYTCNIGLTRDISRAEIYKTREEAEQIIKDFWDSGTPCKRQNPEDYDFSVEEVQITVNVKLPTTFMCKECGKEIPIKYYSASTKTPDSWNSGVCPECIRWIERKMERKRKGEEDKTCGGKYGAFGFHSPFFKI